MHHRRKIAAAATGLLVAAAAAGVGSAAAAGGASKSAKLFVKDGQTYKVGQFAQSHLRFAPTTVTIKSGGTLTLVNQDPSGQEPHTLSVVKLSQLPKSDKQITACGNVAAGSICRSVAIAHGVNPDQQQNGPPPNLVVNAGQPGLDAPGDSVFLAPNFKTMALKVSAKPGTTLHYLCVIHPWMQGTIKVVK